MKKTAFSCGSFRFFQRIEREGRRRKWIDIGQGTRLTVLLGIMVSLSPTFTMPCSDLPITIVPMSGGGGEGGGRVEQSFFSSLLMLKSCKRSRTETVNELYKSHDNEKNI